MNTKDPLLLIRDADPVDPTELEQFAASPTGIALRDRIVASDPSSGSPLVLSQGRRRLFRVAVVTVVASVSVVLAIVVTNRPTRDTITAGPVGAATTLAGTTATTTTGTTATTTTGATAATTTTAGATATTTAGAPGVEALSGQGEGLLRSWAGVSGGGSSVPVYGGTDIPNDEPYDSTFFDNYGVNPRIDTEDDAYSTFAVDVDTGSYTIGRRFLRDGYLPDKDSVRVEEYVNYFDQGYSSPAEVGFAIHLDGGPTPFVENDSYQMIRVGLQSYTPPRNEARPPANLTFVIDVSGSMAREDRLGLVKESLLLLVDNLNPEDQVGIVVYGSRGEVILEPTAVEESDTIRHAINRLVPTGSTNAAEGLKLGYDLARKAYTPGAINRVILVSDGVANVGPSGPNSILELIGEEARNGIQIVTVGFGMGNFNDVLMEQLADNGDGFYAYVDDVREAERLFVHDLTGTLITVAKDAKVQVEFNPDVVERWRLVGFENRDVADEDFRNDQVDAGEIGAGHSVTAIYEVKLAEDADPNAGLATVFMRWEDPESREVIEIDREMRVSDLATDYGELSPRFRLATTVAAYAESLRSSYWAQTWDLDDVAAEAARLADELNDDEDVAEFAELSSKAASISN
jgi:Ca-activated chloride channel family protein